MNSVHEPGPNGDSEKYRVEKLGRKPSQVHQHQNWPNWAHRRAKARACLAVSWALRPCHGLADRSSRGLHGRIAARTGERAVSCAPAPCRRPCCAPLAVSWAWRCIVSRHNAPPYLLSFNWLQSRYNVCIVTQPASPARSLAIHCHTHLASSFHNTLTVLRHTSLSNQFPSHDIIHCILTQPTSLSYNTI